MEDKLVRVASVNGAVEGEILRAMLAAEGVESALSHEAAGTAFGLASVPWAWSMCSYSNATRQKRVG